MSGEQSLARHASAAMEAAYAARPRATASREDFGAGWVSALIWLRSQSSFRAELRLEDVGAWSALPDTKGGKIEGE